MLKEAMVGVVFKHRREHVVRQNLIIPHAAAESRLIEREFSVVPVGDVQPL